MFYPKRRDALAAYLCGALLSACSGNDSNGLQRDDAQPSVGGLPNYGYAGNVSYGGYSAFAGQPWGGVNSASTGGSSSMSDATGGVYSASSGGTTQEATTVAVSGASGTGGASNTGVGVATGGRSSVAGASSTGGRASSSGGTSTGGKASSGETSMGGGATFTGGTSSTGVAAPTGGRQSTGGTFATGGLPNAGGAHATGGAAAFNWGSVTYSPTGGSAMSHQGHNTGAACLASCHSHNFQAGGTIYQSNGTTTAGSIQVGVIMNGALFTSYSGTQGNFYIPITGTLNWATAQIAIRSATGTAIHPVTSGLSGNCNSCHNSSNRITVP